jgi:uncharacterized protein
MATILITGGSGLIGRRLSIAFQQSGHTVRWMSRRPSIASEGLFTWDLARGTMDVAALTGVDHIVHLAGAGIAAKRWNRNRVRELIESRTRGPRLLHRAFAQVQQWPKSFVSAAGVGYYGAATSAHVYTETDPPGKDTIARISKEWESVVDEWAGHSRVVKLRTPVVLAREGGALPKLARTIRWGIGSPLGTGMQWMPWVHIDDLVCAYQRAISDDHMSGAYNVVGGNVTNAELMRTLALVMAKPFFLPHVPGAALKILFGELADVLLKGSRASSERLLCEGFAFKHVSLEDALRDLLVKDLS